MMVTLEPAGAGSVATPARARIVRISGTETPMPSSRPIRAGRKVTRAAGGSTGSVSTAPTAARPPAQRTINWAARSAPRRAIRDSWPFSKRKLASLRSP